jgi:hypothetical protein
MASSLFKQFYKRLFDEFLEFLKILYIKIGFQFFLNHLENHQLSISISNNYSTLVQIAIPFALFKMVTQYSPCFKA